MVNLSIEQIKKAQSKWAQTVISQDISALMSLYADDAVLKPTLSPHIRRSQKDIKSYFVGGGKYDDDGFFSQNIIEVNFTESSPQLLGMYAVDIGKYSFILQDKKTVNAYFTFCYQQNESNDSLIIAHHSSLDT